MIAHPQSQQSTCGGFREAEGQGQLADAGSEAPATQGCFSPIFSCMVATGGDYKGSTCTLVCNSRVHRSDADTAFELVQSDPNLEMKHLVYGNETTRQEHYEKMEKYFETSRKDGGELS